jgi:hypothetical protein
MTLGSASNLWCAGLAILFPASRTQDALLWAGEPTLAISGAPAVEVARERGSESVALSGTRAYASGSKHANHGVGKLALWAAVATVIVLNLILLG